MPYTIAYTPGDYAAFDFSGVMGKRYAHMNDRNPQSLNDDYVRTWTISSAPYVGGWQVAGDS